MVSEEVRRFGHVAGTAADQPDSLHARVRELSVTRELGETLDRVLETVDHDGQVVLKHGR